MTLEDMNINKIYNILCNLNDLESIFQERIQDDKLYDESNTYMEFLNNYFISKNHLSEIYFPIIDAEKYGVVSESLKSIIQLNEVQQIYSDLDVNISKQFNFQCRVPHGCSCFEIVYVFEGEADILLNEKTFSINAFESSIPVII